MSVLSYFLCICCHSVDFYLSVAVCERQASCSGFPAKLSCCSLTIAKHFFFSQPTDLFHLTQCTSHQSRIYRSGACVRGRGSCQPLPKSSRSSQHWSLNNYNNSGPTASEIDCSRKITTSRNSHTAHPWCQSKCGAVTSNATCAGWLRCCVIIATATCQMGRLCGPVWTGPNSIWRLAKNRADSQAMLESTILVS